MSTLPPIDPANASGRAAELLAEVQKTFGVTPNMTKAMANSPALLQGYLSLSGALSTGVLTAGVRERLALATAEYNRCSYCLSAHTFIGLNIANVDADELANARHAESEDEHIEALLTMSDAIARGRGVIGADVLQAARDSGVTDAEIAEVVGHIALNVLTNYFNLVARVDIDWPVVTPHVHAA